MNKLGRLAQIVGLNAIPIVGLLLYGWSDGTALALYWFETLIAIFLVALRIRIHRKVTNKRGHFIGQKKYFTQKFLLFGLGLLLIPGIFVAVAIQHVDVHALRNGLLLSVVFLSAGFALDMTIIREQPFMWIRRMANNTWWRALLVDIAGLIGALGVGFDFPRAGVVTFIILKIYTDIAANFNDYDPREPPKWMLALNKNTKELRLWWADEYDDRHKIYIEDEEPFDGRFSRPVTYQAK